MAITIGGGACVARPAKGWARADGGSNALCVEGRIKTTRSAAGPHRGGPFRPARPSGRRAALHDRPRQNPGLESGRRRSGKSTRGAFAGTHQRTKGQDTGVPGERPASPAFPGKRQPGERARMSGEQRRYRAGGREIHKTRTVRFRERPAFCGFIRSGCAGRGFALANQAARAGTGETSHFCEMRTRETRVRETRDERNR